MTTHSISTKQAAALRPILPSTHPQNQGGNVGIKFTKRLQMESRICPTLASQTLDKPTPASGTEADHSLLRRGSWLGVEQQKQLRGCPGRLHIAAQGPTPQLGNLEPVLLCPVLLTVLFSDGKDRNIPATLRRQQPTSKFREQKAPLQKLHNNLKSYFAKLIFFFLAKLFHNLMQHWKKWGLRPKPWILAQRE